MSNADAVAATENISASLLRTRRRIAQPQFRLQRRLSTTLANAAEISASLIPPILHYSAPEPYTKFEICLVFSKLLDTPIAHITPDDSEPTGAAAVSRPRDCRLYTRETEDMMEGAGGLGTTGFEEWWAEYLGVDKV